MAETRFPRTLVQKQQRLPGEELNPLKQRHLGLQGYFGTIWVGDIVGPLARE